MKQRRLSSLTRILAIICALTMVFALAACKTSTDTDTSGDKTSETATKDTATNDTNTSEADASGTESSGPTKVVVGISADPGSLNPWLNPTAGFNAISTTLYQNLALQASVGSEPEPCIMKSYELVDDVTIHVTIFDYVHDAAGNEITASDVVFSYETCIEMGYKTSIIKYVAGIEYVDEDEMNIVLKSAPAAGVVESVLTGVSIVSQSAYEASGDEFASFAIGTTGYILTDYTEGSSLTFEKTGNYWQTDESLVDSFSYANVDTIDFKVITETTQMAIALEQNEIEISSSIASDDVARFEESSDYNVYSSVSTRGNFLIYNGQGVMQNQLLRQAIAYAINDQAIVDGVYDGRGLTLYTVGSPVYGDYQTAWESEDYYDYNVETAQALMDEAGYSNGLDIVLMTTNSSEFESMAQLIQYYLSEIGITVTIESYEEALVLEYAMGGEHPYDLFLNASGSNDYLTSLWKRSLLGSSETVTSNYFEDPELISLLGEILTIDGHTAENVNAFHQRLKEQCYIYGINTFYAYIITSSDVTECVYDFRGFAVPGACTYSFQ